MEHKRITMPPKARTCRANKILVQTNLARRISAPQYATGGLPEKKEREMDGKRNRSATIVGDEEEGGESTGGRRRHGH